MHDRIHVDLWRQIAGDNAAATAFCTFFSRAFPLATRCCICSDFKVGWGQRVRGMQLSFQHCSLRQFIANGTNGRVQSQSFGQ
eukprot:2198994-Pyramimonas_sp.AAC.1